MTNEVLTMPNDFEQISALVDGHLPAAQAAALLARSQFDMDLRAAWHGYHLIGDVLRAGAVQEQAGFVTGTVSKPVSGASSPLMSVDSFDAANASLNSFSSNSATFLANFHARLAAEALFLAAAKPNALPQALPSGAVHSEFDATRTQSIAAPNAEAANASLFRWKLASGFASMAAVAAIGWGALSSGFLGLGDAEQTTANNTSQNSQQSPQQIASNGIGTVAATGSVAVNAVAQSGDASAVMQRDPRFEAYLAAHKQFGGASALAQPAGFLRSANFEAGR